jgi:CHASE3 domain sensor protein
MPVDVMVVFAIIVCVFVVFGAVLYWGERRTRDMSSHTIADADVKRRAF